MAGTIIPDIAGTGWVPLTLRGFLVWKNGNGGAAMTIPAETGFKPGDKLQFYIDDWGRILLKKV